MPNFKIRQRQTSLREVTKIANIFEDFQSNIFITFYAQFGKIFRKTDIFITKHVRTRTNAHISKLHQSQIKMIRARLELCKNR